MDADPNIPIPNDPDDIGPASPEWPVRTWHLSLAYDGTNYFGWQVQDKNRKKTVQGELRTRIRLILHAPELKVYGCSRTDAGVHALDQHASFTTPTPPDCTPDWLRDKLNRWLPDDILVKSAEITTDGFNARYDNFGKAYTYCLSPSNGKLNPMLAPFVWKARRPLDTAAMRAAAQYLVGEHDFSSFATNSGNPVETMVRRVHRLELLEKDGLLFLNAVGESFLYKMVRTLAGWLVHVGCGYASPEDTLDVLSARDRTRAADAAPAKGLFLAKVFWSPEEWRSYQPILPPFAINALP
ncbi:MAG: tRNA pseudouridine(38-40) synthase TruA [Victivallales bacterium]|nr:tRNA pseudouridine(38-40) synthase TruA [Victivallales bacterium]